MGKGRASKRRVRRRTSRRRTRGPWLLIGGGLALLLIVVSAYWAWGRTPAAGASAEAVSYDPADVVYDDGLYGVHEMEPSQTPIPFLPKDGPQPKLVIPQDFWDFGEVGPTDVVDHTFVLKNEGEAPLTISRIYTTCGCTTAELSARVIPPGKVALLRLIFDAGYHDVRGQTVRRGIIIENNDPNYSEAAVWSEAFVKWR
ncbi:MAG: DUF1573 domain-containing protein [Chloroflexi bacterium]|nr:DUF1573 domain-containing protein [Chloroflexota bacterium]